MRNLAQISKGRTTIVISHRLQTIREADMILVLDEGNLTDTGTHGQLLERNIWEIMPFDNRIVVGKFKGADLPPIAREGHEIDPGKTYTFATSDYVAETSFT